MTKLKVKIQDVVLLRGELDIWYESLTQVEACKYALKLADHILELVDYQDKNNAIIQEAYLVNKQWQKGKASMNDVRQAGFKVHQLAREADNKVIETALRVVGQGVSTGHMKEHGMVASDYAIKVINLLHPGDMDAVQKEREWQLEQVKRVRG